MSLPHQYTGDNERLLEASLAAFNKMRPVDSEVMLLPKQVPVKTVILGPAFVQGAEILVRVRDSAEPVNIQRIKGVGQV